jgi:hypothetical protein
MEEQLAHLELESIPPAVLDNASSRAQRGWQHAEQATKAKA